MAISPSDAAHLLRRSGFGVTPTMLAELTALPDREAAIQRVTDISRSPSIADLPVSNAKQSNEGTAFVSLVTWWLERMRTSPVPFVEKLTLFWHDHFVSSVSKLGDTGLLAQQHRTLRAYGTGDFHTLAQKLAVDPAMVVYLDNYLNVWWSRQENFGREVMELFTLGVGQYTQKDVVSMTKAWTGHTLDATAAYRSYKYIPSYHDSSQFTLFGKRQAWNGPAALTEVITGVKADACARFITAKLFSQFAYPVTPDDAVVTPLAAGFRSSGLDIVELCREIFRSDAFWAPATRGAVVRSPIEWVVAAMQAFGTTTAESVTTGWLDRMGQVPFAHHDVNGWPTGEAWLSTATFWGKSSWAGAMRYTLYGRGYLSDIGPMSASDAIAAACAKVGVVDLTPTTRTALEELHARSRAGGYWYTIGINMAMLLVLSPEFQVA